MAMKSYNNNDRGPTNTTYSGISFSNPESTINQSRLSISYFNKVMKVSIALRNNAGSNDGFATYDTENAVSVYVSNIKAYVLYQMIEQLKNDPDTHNIGIDLKNGLLKISDGSEYGTKNYCISIMYSDDAGNVNEVVYESKMDYHTGIYNYENGQFSSKAFSDIELDAFAMTLYEYYKASSYALAASVMEANMYKREYTTDLIKQIAEKVGVQVRKGGNGSYSNNSTFLDRSNGSGSKGSNSYSNNSRNNSMNDNTGYELTTFDSIADAM